MRLFHWLIDRGGRKRLRDAPAPPAHCPACQGELIAHEFGLPGSLCRNCRRYYPSAEERAETRTLFQNWRRLLLVVADLHKLGYEGARIIPFIVDSAGGGDWHCILAPAAMVSPSHGARIGEAIDWWGGTCSPGRDFPYLMARGVRGLPGLPPGFASAENMIQAYPKLAEHCLGCDRGYAEWYQAMLRATEPEGVVYADAFWDDRASPPQSGLRVLGPEGQREVLVPLPPPGAANLVLQRTSPP